MHIIPPFLSLFPSFSHPDVLCDPTAIIWSKVPHLRRWLVVQPFIGWSPNWGFPGFPLSCKENARRSVHSPRYHLIITLSSADRRNRRDTPGNWPLAMNPDRSWRRRHSGLKISWPQPMVPWTRGRVIEKILTDFTNLFVLKFGWNRHFIHKVPQGVSG